MALLLRLYDVVNQEDVRNVVSREMFEDQWARAEHLKQKRIQKNNQVPAIKVRLVQNWGVELQGLHEWFPWTFNFAAKLQNLLN